MTRWRMSVLWSTAVLFVGCNTDPVHVDRAHIKQSAAPARRATAKKLACAIQWQGLHDVREIKDPIGYIGLKAVQFPELRDELDQRMRDTIARTGAEAQSASSMIVEVDLLRSYVEHHATLIVFNTWFRINTETQSTKPAVRSSAK